MAINDLYERDFTAWAEAQAEALRNRSANAIDWENVAEEIESVGRSDSNSFYSQVEQILLHFLKIEYAESAEPVAHWRREVRVARINLDKKATPTLLARAPEDLSKRYAYARRMAVIAFDEHGDDVVALPDACPYTWDDVIGRGEDWMPNPRVSL
jgi:hypothetical protein